MSLLVGSQDRRTQPGPGAPTPASTVLEQGVTQHFCPSKIKDYCAAN
jgi:hypothetical protein